MGALPISCDTEREGGECAIFSEKKILRCGNIYHLSYIRPRNTCSCVQVSEVKRIRLGRSNIFYFGFLFLQFHSLLNSSHLASLKKCVRLSLEKLSL